MMRLTLAFGVLMAITCSECLGQPLVDRVIDRIEGELGTPVQPIPVTDDVDENRPTLPVTNEEPGYLGIVADDREEQGNGVRILEVVENGPAAQGGLAKSDLITSINTVPIRTMEEMARILSTMPAGEKIAFGVRRGTANSNVDVTLGNRPAPEERKFEQFGRQPEALPANPSARPKLGVRTLPISEQARQQFNLPSRDGALVATVTAGSPAQKAGLKMGAVITSVNGQAVRNPDELATIVGNSVDPQLALAVIQDGRPARVVVKMQDEPFDEPAPSSNSGTLVLPENSNSELEALQRRLQQLEDRLEKVEQLLEKRS